MTFLKKLWHKTKRFAHREAVKLSHVWKHIRRHGIRKREVIILLVAIFFIALGGTALWLSSLTIPNLDSFANRKVAQSTKIYDKTGTVLLYDLNQGVKRTVVPGDQISLNIKNAVVATEDAQFYTNKGIEPTAIFRALVSNLESGCLSCGQGGSTITQQVVKNTLLNGDRSFSRKIKEWVLSLKIEKILTKDQILTLYLNESPYGGTMYGVEEASETFFGKHASDVTIAEAAYLASMLKGPSYYSPYGPNVDKLNARQKFVLQRMIDEHFISQDDYNKASAEKVVFLPQETVGIKAPHFVNYVIADLTARYGEDMVNQGGLHVITTLDYSLQQKAEALTKQYALQNEKTYKAKNAAAVAIDPKTGGILVMVGSRDYFDKEIDGNYNVVTSARQPGSTFKPIVYATAFEKGYRPETVVFDVKTEFSTECNPDGTPMTADANCYEPEDFDGLWPGPIDLRHALGESRNIPAIKMLYLAGLQDSLNTAKDMGITTLTNTDQYGLTLVLGGGEVTPLELASAYTSFAGNGVRAPYRDIERVEDSSGNIIDSFPPQPAQVIPEQPALLINDILSDYSAKDPNELLHFTDRPVASKTGTTNNYRDAWVVGYTPNMTLLVWAGNNDDTPMDKKIAGYVAAPLWRAIMDQLLASVPPENFKAPDPVDLSTIKPALAGAWRGGQSFVIDKVSGKLATDATPAEDRVTEYTGDIHTILQWVDKSDPTGPAPTNPAADPQYSHWEYGVQQWLLQHPEVAQPVVPPSGTDDVHNSSLAPQILITQPDATTEYAPADRITVELSHMGRYPLQKTEFYVNGAYLGSSQSEPFSFSFVPGELAGIQATSTLRVVGTDNVGNRGETSMQFKVSVPANN